MTLSQDRAETVALQALAWIAGDEDLAPRFAGATGSDLSEAGDRVQDPAFLAGVLEFLTMEDAWIRRFCDEVGLPYETPMRALLSLPGQMRPEWP